jgi:hypothetical protein
MWFLRVISILFLIIFLIKLINPKVVPYLKDFFHSMGTLIRFTSYLFFNSFFYGANLLMKRTVYVMTVVIFVTLFLTSAVTLYITYDQLSFTLFYNVFKSSVFSLYVFSFFVSTYLLGLYEVLKEKTSFHNKLIDSFRFKFMRMQQKSGKYVYDEVHNRYTYKK